MPSRSCLARKVSHQKTIGQSGVRGSALNCEVQGRGSDEGRSVPLQGSPKLMFAAIPSILRLAIRVAFIALNIGITRPSREFLPR